MKNWKRLVAALSVAWGISASALAQNGLSVYVGGNAVWGGVLLLIGAFSSADDEGDDYAYGEDDDSWERHEDTDKDLPYFPMGANVGLKYQLGLGKDLAMFASADVFYRNLNDKALKSPEDMVRDEVLPSSVNFPVLMGFNYTIKRFPYSSLWVESGVGVSFRRIEVQRTVGGTWPDNVEVSVSRHWGVVPAWKTGVGLTSQRVSMELCCHAFCNYEVEGAFFAREGNVVADWGHKLARGIAAERLRLPMICFRMGYCF